MESVKCKVTLTHFHTLHLHTNKRGQALFEYVILAVVIIAALVSMQIYIKRGISGRWREAADSVGVQYDPLNTWSNYTTTVIKSRTDNVAIQDMNVISNGNTVRVKVTTTDSTFSTNTTKIGNETVGALSNTIW